MEILTQPSYIQTRGPETGDGFPMKLKPFFSLLKATAAEWWNDNTFRLAASLAFYTIFSLAPIIIISIGVAGLFLGRERAARGIMGQLETLTGPQGGAAIHQLSTSIPNEHNGPLAIAIGILAVLIGSTVVFAELQSALNQIWDVQIRPERSFLRGLIRDRLQSFALALSVGFLLLVSLVVSAVISGLAVHLQQRTPDMPWIWQTANAVISFVIVTILFGLIYKYLPDVKITWSDVSMGAAVTAVLFTVGKYLIGAYLGRFAVASTYGAAGSFVLFLLWVYYSALICFFGAEFTQVYARRYGSKIRPQAHAMRKGLKPDGA